MGAEVSDWARLKRADEPRLPKELAEAISQAAGRVVMRETATDRVVAYFEGILGRPLTRAEKIPIPAILAGDTEEML